MWARENRVNEEKKKERVASVDRVYIFIGKVRFGKEKKNCSSVAFL